MDIIKFDFFIKKIKEKTGLKKQSDIAKYLNVSPQSISNWKRDGQVPFKFYKIIEDQDILLMYDLVELQRKTIKLLEDKIIDLENDLSVYSNN